MMVAELHQNLFHSTEFLFYQSRVNQLIRIYIYDLVRQEHWPLRFIDPEIILKIRMENLNMNDVGKVMTSIRFWRERE